MYDFLSHIDKTAWALMFISVSVNMILVVVQFKFRSLPPVILAVLLTISVGLFLFGCWLAYIDYSKPPPPVPPPGPRPPVPLSSIEKIFPPESAIDIRPLPGARALSFFLADWVSWSASNIEVSTWMTVNGHLVKVGTHSYKYIGNGDSVTLTETVSPPPPSTVALCVSYELNKHHVEVIHFFANADGSGYRRSRDSIFEVDGSGRLCNSMPAPAQRVL
jgi:hypothetical protein